MRIGVRVNQPAMMCKRPAWLQQPNGYLEPKWLRCIDWGNMHIIKINENVANSHNLHIDGTPDCDRTDGDRADGRTDGRNSRPRPTPQPIRTQVEDTLTPIIFEFQEASSQQIGFSKF